MVNVNVYVIYLMSITRGVLAQSPEPEAHDKVLDNNPDRIGARTRTNNKLNPHMTPSPGIEPGPHWWEACVGGKCSTTAPSLLPNNNVKRTNEYCAASTKDTNDGSKN